MDRSRNFDSVQVPHKPVVDFSRSQADLRARTWLETSKNLPKFAEETIKQYLGTLKGFKDQDLSKLKLTTDNEGKINIDDGMRRYPLDHQQLKNYDSRGYRALEYKMMKETIRTELGLGVDSINGLNIHDSVFRYKDRSGVTQEISGENSEDKENFEKIKEKIESQLSSLGFDVNKSYISDFRKKAAIDRFAAKEEDEIRRAALKKSLEDGTVLDYTYNAKTGKHEYYIMKAEKVNGENRDGEIEKITFTKAEHYAVMLKAANLSENEVNGLNRRDGVYSYESKNGRMYILQGKEEYDRIKQAFEELSSSGRYADKSNISIFRKEAVIDKFVAKEEDEIRRAALKKSLEDRMVLDYTYNAETGKHEYHIMKTKEGNGENGDGEIEKITFTKEEHDAVTLKAANLSENEVNGLNRRNGVYNYKSKDGIMYILQDKEAHDRIKQAFEELSSLERYTDKINISYFRKEAVIDKFAAKEKDESQRAVLKKSLENGTILDYTYDAGTGTHAYYIIKANAGNGENRDEEIEKITFTKAEHDSIMLKAEFNAVKEFYNEGLFYLENNKKVESVKFIKRDEEYSITDIYGKKHRIPKDGALRRHIENALSETSSFNDKSDIHNLDNLDIITDPKAIDAKLESLKKARARYEMYSKALLRTLKVMQVLNAGFLQASASVEQAMGGMMGGGGGNSNPLQQTSLDNGLYELFEKHAEQHLRRMDEEKKSLEENKELLEKSELERLSSEHDFLKKVKQNVDKQHETIVAQSRKKI